MTPLVRTGHTVIKGIETVSNKNVHHRTPLRTNENAPVLTMERTIIIKITMIGTLMVGIPTVKTTNPRNVVLTKIDVDTSCSVFFCTRVPRCVAGVKMTIQNISVRAK